MSDRTMFPHDPEALLKEARDRFDRAYERDRHNLEAEIEDLEFEAGHQWPEAYLREREGRPCLTINQTKQFVKLTTGDIRQLRPAMRAVPVDDAADAKIAEIIGDHLRYIENRSNARYAYTRAADRQVIAGIGHWRVATDYADATTFNQELLIEAIDGQVLWDPDAIAPTREDAAYCFVYVDMNREAFREAYPDHASDGDFERIGLDGSEDSGLAGAWSTDDTIRLAEYWVKRPITRRLLVSEDGRIDDLTDEDPESAALKVSAAAGATLRERPGYRVMRYLLTESSVLEADRWRGRYIPIVPLIGEETRIGRKVIRHGVVRHLKDAQRRYNYFVSAETEIVALQPKAPWLGTVTNFSEDDEWQYANTKNLPYLTFVPDPKNGGVPPQRVQPPVSSQGLGQGLALAAEDMKRVTGKYAPSLGAVSNETSGVAIAARQRQGDTGTFVYLDNFSLAVTHTGRIVLDLIPHIYDTERLIGLSAEDGEQRRESINRRVIDPAAPDAVAILNDVTVGSYDVVTTLGPSYATKRAEARDSMIEFGRTMPQQAQVFADLIAKAQDWPGADEIAKRLRRMIPPQILDEPGPPPEPDPDTRDAQAKAQIDLQSKLFDLEAQRRRLLLDLDRHRARVIAEGRHQVAEGHTIDDALNALGALDGIGARHAEPAADLDVMSKDSLAGSQTGTNRAPPAGVKGPDAPTDGRTVPENHSVR
ncbi:MAG: portal protein [Pseudomonadota bacterium]